MQKTKYVRFDLYRAVITLEQKYEHRCSKVQEKLKNFDESEAEKWTPSQRKSFFGWLKHKNDLEIAQRSANSPWILSDVILASVNGRLPNTIMEYHDDKIEIDKLTFFQKDNTPWLMSVQISRLRADSLPAKKKLGKPRSDIALDDDEYIGEFTEVLFDARFNVVAIQANRYGVGVSAICRYLNFLHKQYTELQGSQVPEYTIGELQPIIDGALTEKAFEAEHVRKIHLRCSDVNADAIIPEDNLTLGSSVRIIGEQKGVVLDVTLAVRGREPSRSLPTSDIRNVGSGFVKFMNDPEISAERKKDAKMEVTIWNEEDAAAEAVDLMVPKVNFIIPLSIEERKPIGSEYLYDVSAEEYSKQTGRLNGLLGK
jgi:hypothetical protein